MKDNKGTDKFKSLIIWVAIAIALVVMFNTSKRHGEPSITLDYSEFLEKVHAGQVSKVTIEGKNTVKGTITDGTRFNVYAPSDAWMISDLLKSKVKVLAKPEEEPSILMTILL